MKKWLIGLLAAALTLLVGFAAAEEADTLTSGDWEYRILENGTAEITAYNNIINGMDPIEIPIPDELDGITVSSIESNPFRIYNATAFTVSPDHPYFEVVDGVLFSKADKRLIVYPLMKEAAAYTIPDGTEIIGESAFFLCRNLNSITIPDSVREIGNGAFFYCTELTSIRIPEGVTSISESMFNGCNALTSVTLPDSVTSIGALAFSDCWNLTFLKIPDSVTSVDINPFYNCKQLVLTLSPDHPALEIVDGVLFSKLDKRLIRCPSMKRSAAYAVPEGTQTIGAYAFSFCDALTSITLPNSVTKIDYGAFWGCAALTDIDIPDGITTIEGETFSLCVSLNSIVLPDGITEIGAAAFNQCNALTNINIPDSVTSIGENAFAVCLSLASISLPDGVTSIGYNAFGGCPNLTLVVGHHTYAAQYAEENNIPYAFPASDS